MANSMKPDFLSWVQSRIESELGLALDRETVAAVLRAEREWQGHRLATASERLPIS